MELVKFRKSIEQKVNEITTKKEAGETLVLLQAFIKEIKKLDSKVREKAIDILDEEDEKNIDVEIIDKDTGEIKQYKIYNRPGIITKEYDPEKVFEAFGPLGVKFMKVKKTAVDNFIKEGLKKNAIDGRMAELAQENAIEKIRSGGIIVKEIK